MSASPEFKVYSPTGEYVASCKHPEDAAAIISSYGRGATIRYRHRRLLWEEGKEIIPAGESYDRVNEIVTARLKARPT